MFRFYCERYPVEALVRREKNGCGYSPPRLRDDHHCVVSVLHQFHHHALQLWVEKNLRDKLCQMQDVPDGLWMIRGRTDTKNKMSSTYHLFVGQARLMERQFGTRSLRVRFGCPTCHQTVRLAPLFWETHP